MSISTLFSDAGGRSKIEFVREEGRREKNTCTASHFRGGVILVATRKYVLTLRGTIAQYETRIFDMKWRRQAKHQRQQQE